jgi:hypothetical protein
MMMSKVQRTGSAQINPSLTGLRQEIMFTNVNQTNSPFMGISGKI